MKAKQQPEKKTKYERYGKKYYQQHKEYFRDYQREYKREHPQQITEEQRKSHIQTTLNWRKRNDEHYKKYMNGWQAERRLKVKQKIVKYLGGKCIICGYSKHIAALECHHRDGSTKELRISSAYGINWDKLKEELDKCDLLCANCHQIWHYEHKRED